jgi:hypothetical protein
MQAPEAAMIPNGFIINRLKIVMETDARFSTTSRMNPIIYPFRASVVIIDDVRCFSRCTILFNPVLIAALSQYDPSSNTEPHSHRLLYRG